MFILPTISELDQTAAAAARERQAQLTKPAGSLGQNEMAAFAEAGVSDKE